MGSAASTLPEKLSENEIRQLCGTRFRQEEYDKLKDHEGCVSKENFLLVINKGPSSDFASGLSKFEKYSPYVMESYLRGKCWNESEFFQSFYRLNCSRFLGFKAVHADQRLSSINDDGRGYDLELTRIHNDFLTELERLLETQLQIMDISNENFVKAAEHGISSKEFPSHFQSELDRYSDFLAFGEMMEEKCLVLFPHLRSKAPEPSGLPPAPAPPHRTRRWGKALRQSSLGHRKPRCTTEVGCFSGRANTLVLPREVGNSRRRCDV